VCDLNRNLVDVNIFSHTTEKEVQKTEYLSVSYGTDHQGEEILADLGTDGQI
jgi:hypothetical protein